MNTFDRAITLARLLGKIPSHRDDAWLVGVASGDFLRDLLEGQYYREFAGELITLPCPAKGRIDMRRWNTAWARVYLKQEAARETQHDT